MHCHWYLLTLHGCSDKGMLTLSGCHDMVLQVIELKGNIRVLARIRPMIEKERSAACSEGGGVQEAVRVADEETVVLDAANGPREFSFDRVFGPSDGQPAVYDEVSGLVTSVMDGYNACIMAYGQTGSGKTYTIEGPAADPGINSRALAELFEVAHERSAEVAYTLSASVLEIYQEQIFDLLTGSKDTGEPAILKCCGWKTAWVNSHA